MKYPRQWDANSKVFISSHRVDGRWELCLSVYIHRPGTPHHTRKVIAKLDATEATLLKNSITSLLARKDGAA